MSIAFAAHLEYELKVHQNFTEQYVELYKAAIAWG